MSKDPFRILGIVFTSIAAIELLVVLVLLVSGLSTAPMIALPFGLQCLIFGGVGGGFLIGCHRKQAKRERLLANGYYEMATVVAIEQNPYVRVNHRSPYFVICRIERDGVLHEYRSESCYDLPGLKPGDQVPVYLDRREEKDYYVDLVSTAPTIIRH